ncbi:hypothetical protein LTR70_001649 [Exophiala xenobiotica]|uniref:Kinesin light chain n=1 Tax=Lithohypha guttulata TaxID=1690604 RepID=A0ABR0KHD4_9EURO|nr:hypothetical protein LTR24_002540 [Lithohypha guttulata]KAK5327174.1 hypothetical protein LTR70_001649 [Exophiala xenobiotica]
MATTFTSHGTVHSSAGIQNIHGSAYHAPIYNGPVHLCHPDASPKNRRLSEIRRPLSKIPFSRDSHFIARQAIFDKIEEAVRTAGSAALYGLGGIGKSQIAIEYAYRFSNLHPKAHVLWIYAGTNDRIVQEYQAISRRLRLEGYDDPKVDQCQLVLDWLEEDQEEEEVEQVGNLNRDDQRKQWLIVLDNLDDATTLDQPLRAVGPGFDDESLVSKTLRDYLPWGNDQEHVLLVTTRNEDVARDMTEDELCVLIEPLTSEEAQELFLTRLGRHKLGTSDSAAIDPLVNHLGCIPLAISQAAAYVTRCRVTVSNYFARLQKDDEQLNTHLTIELQDPRRQKGWPNSIFRTWKLSFDQIQKNDAEAGDLLSLMAILDGQEIPVSLLSSYFGSPSVFEMALGTLYGYSLVSGRAQNDSVSVHPLVQTSVRFWLAEVEKRATFVDRAIGLLASVFPQGEHENQEICRLLLPHASSVLKYHVAGKAESQQYAVLLYHLSWYLWRCGRYNEAYQHAQSAYDTWKVLFEQLSAPALDALSLSALILRYLGKYRKSKELNQAALEGRETVLGLNHPHTLTSVHNLAGVLESEGKYLEAEAMSQRALENRRIVLGEDHADTLATLSHLALIRQYRGNYEEAEQYSLQALNGRRKVLGPEHPHTLTSMNNLGILLLYRGRYKDAEEMCEQALQGRKKVLGADHPHTLSSISNLVSVYEGQGLYHEAETMNRRVLEGRQKTLGSEHPDTLTSVSNLASLLHSQGKYQEAASMNQQAFDGLQKILGLEHPHTLTVASNTVCLLCSQGTYDKAEELCRSTLQTMVKTLGTDNPRTLASIGDLASLLEHQGKYIEAEQICRKVRDKSEQVLGATHPLTLTFTSNLASVLQHQGKYSDASDLNLRALEGRRSTLGASHPDTWKSLSHQALIRQKQGRYREAEKLSRELLTGREQNLGSDHPQTLSTLSSLALVLQCQHKYYSAEGLLRNALAGFEKSLGTEHPLTLSCMDNLACVLRLQTKSGRKRFAMHKINEAETLVVKALELSEKVVGKDHPDTMRLIDSRAVIAVAKEDDELAEELTREVTKARKKALGPKHPSTLTSLENLAMILKNQEHYPQAERLLRQILQKRKEVLGPNHPSTINSMSRLAKLLAVEWKFEQSLLLYQRAFLKRRRMLGLRHAQTQLELRGYTSILLSRARLLDYKKQIWKVYGSGNSRMRITSTSAPT